MRRILIKLVIIFSLFACAGLYGLYWLHSWGVESGKLKSAVTVPFPQGTRLITLAQSLESRKVISNDFLFFLYVKIFHDYKRFQAGNYRFKAATKPIDVVEKISSGDAFQPVVLQFTIPEGFSMKQVINRLAKLKVASRADLLKLANDKKFLRSLNLNSTSLEGYLYPATYSFNRRPSAREVFKKMVSVFWNRLPEGYIEKLKPLKLTLDQAVVMASLIEVETLFEDEKPYIAEVIWRRYKDRVPLGIDAAIIYGIKDYRGDIKWKHLKDAKNPYNTRIHKGLPPTAICSPTESSLSAIINPSNKGYYYYVLTAGGGRRHHFSRTLEEHNKHVKLLIEASKTERSK